MSPSDDDVQDAQPRITALPLLAPRDNFTSLASSSSSSRDRAGYDARGRRARLSHRSRAGCWTCRGRKVKCDEQHPRCGQCTRLDRQCDWEHRWQFNDATTGTQIKHSNVFIAGNAVWDPSARSSPSGSESPLKAEELPPFSELTNDEDRERLAGATVPGTYGVVVTPDSFAGLPEYSASASPIVERRRSSTRSSRLSQISSYPGHTAVRTDPNIVILDRFEEASALSPSLVSPFRRASLPISINTAVASAMSPVTRSATLPSTPAGEVTSESKLIAYFRQHTAYRIIPRINGGGDGQDHDDAQSSVRTSFILEAARFIPLYHAICALSALDLYYKRQARYEDALGHYDKALAPRMSNLDLTSDGSFLRHFLLLIYDLSFTCVDSTNGGQSMWAVHLVALQNIIAERARTKSSEPYGYLIWLICNLDMYASLLGNGDCAFFGEIMQSSRLPPLIQQQPSDMTATLMGGSLEHSVLNLNQDVVMQTARIAHAAFVARNEFAAMGDETFQLLPRWTARITQLQEQLVVAWTASCPPSLNSDAMESIDVLSPAMRSIFEDALVLFHTTMIYSRTSMFPSQRMMMPVNYADLVKDTEARAELILSIAEQRVVRQALDQRSIVFPIFMAGYASLQSDLKVRTMNLLRTYEESGIGHNTSIIRQLFTAVCREQSQCIKDYRRMEEVEWMQISFDRGLRVSNCGL